MKFLRRVVKFVFFVFLLSVLGIAVMFYRSGQQPDWYALARKIDPATAIEASKRAQDKLGETISWAAGRQAAEIRSREGEPVESDPFAPTPDATLTLSFTEEELNALFQKQVNDPAVRWE